MRVKVRPRVRKELLVRFIEKKQVKYTGNVLKETNTLSFIVMLGIIFILLSFFLYFL